VVYVTAAVLPVGELGLVVTLLDDGCVVLGRGPRLLFGRLHIDRLERSLLRRRHVHRVRVYDARLFLKVEGVLFGEDSGLFEFVGKFLLVEGGCRALRVRIPHESVRASHHSPALRNFKNLLDISCSYLWSVIALS
jgi:hypothetical protein